MAARLLLAATAIAALSLLAVAPAPSYDPWAWLLWGREIAGGELSTAEGPSFKPGAVIVTAPLALLGGAAPVAWVLIARTGAVLALLLAFRLGRRLAADLLRGSAPDGDASGGRAADLRDSGPDGLGAASGRRAAARGARVLPAAAGVLAAAGIGLSGGYTYYAASGMVVGWVVALGLAGLEAWRAGRPRAALACGIACALLHVESWPFLAAFGLVLWRRCPRDRPLLALAAAAIPALWLIPELLGSGNLVRAAERAQVPNPGQPATADFPALASLSEAAAIPPWPLWLGLAAVAVAATHAQRARAPSASPAGRSERRALLARGRGGSASALAGRLVPLARVGGPAARALAPAAAGAAWVAIVAAMSQLGGFSGEPRYAAPGIALVAISGAVGLALVAARLVGAPRAVGPTGTGRGGPRRTAARMAVAFAVALALGAAALPRVDDGRAVAVAQADQWALASDLGDAVRAAGGREAVLACGTPYVAPLRGPLMAYRLDVPKHVVEPDLPPRPPGVVFQWRGSPEAPAGPALSAAAGAPAVGNGRGSPEAPGLSAAAGAPRVRGGRRAGDPPAFGEVARGNRWRVLRSC